MKFIFSVLFLIIAFFVSLIVLACGGGWLLVFEILGIIVITCWVIGFIVGIFVVALAAKSVLDIRKKVIR